MEAPPTIGVLGPLRQRVSSFCGYDARVQEFRFHLATEAYHTNAATPTISAYDHFGRSTLAERRGPAADAQRPTPLALSFGLNLDKASLSSILRLA